MNAPFGTGLSFPHPDIPPGGTLAQVAPGIFWLRMPLPFQLNHINLWLVEEHGGFAMVDTGINLPATKELWEQLYAGPMKGRPITRLIATHMHPDHIGLAGWHCERHRIDLWTTLGEFQGAHSARRGLEGEEVARKRFYHGNGVGADGLELFAKHRGGYAEIVAPLPADFRRLRDGEIFMFGERPWRVIVGLGHAPEHACLYSPDLNVLIAGDQVLPKITTNVSVWPIEPKANALQWFLDTIDKLYDLPEDTLVLPSHGLPFTGLHTRLDQLVAHHDERLDALAAAALSNSKGGLTAVELTPTLFPRHLDNHQFVFALGETVAHVHCLEEAGRLRRTTDASGVHRFAAVGDQPPAHPITDDTEPGVV